MPHVRTPAQTGRKVVSKRKRMFAKRELAKDDMADEQKKHDNLIQQIENNKIESCLETLNMSWEPIPIFDNNSPDPGHLASISSATDCRQDSINDETQVFNHDIKSIFRSQHTERTQSPSIGLPLQASQLNHLQPWTSYDRPCLSHRKRLASHQISPKASDVINFGDAQSLGSEYPSGARSKFEPGISNLETSARVLSMQKKSVLDPQISARTEQDNETSNIHQQSTGMLFPNQPNYVPRPYFANHIHRDEPFTIPPPETIISSMSGTPKRYKLTYAIVRLPELELARIFSGSDLTLPDNILQNQDLAAKQDNGIHADHQKKDNKMDSITERMLYMHGIRPIK